MATVRGDNELEFRDQAECSREEDMGRCLIRLISASPYLEREAAKVASHVEGC
jgi:hypothetical protein